MIEFLRDDDNAVFARVHGEDISLEEFFDRRLGGIWESNLLEAGRTACRYFLHTGKNPFGKAVYMELTEQEAVSISVETKRDIRRK